MFFFFPPYKTLLHKKKKKKKKKSRTWWSQEYSWSGKDGLFHLVGWKWKEGLSMEGVPILPFLPVGVVYCAMDICNIDVTCMKGWSMWVSHTCKRSFVYTCCTYFLQLGSGMERKDCERCVCAYFILFGATTCFPFSLQWFSWMHA